mmetsp:Transcript_28182/g.66724  ORF Transcript_28182/g.66724 Transcript_28182/m.66724 type:complete len:209 (-) Transcript_28182:56-682(-)
MAASMPPSETLAHSQAEQRRRVAQPALNTSKPTPPSTPRPTKRAAQQNLPQQNQRERCGASRLDAFDGRVAGFGRGFDSPDDACILVSWKRSQLGKARVDLRGRYRRQQPAGGLGVEEERVLGVVEGVGFVGHGALEAEVRRLEGGEDAEADGVDGAGEARQRIQGQVHVHRGGRGGRGGGGGGGERRRGGGRGWWCGVPLLLCDAPY